VSGLVLLHGFSGSPASFDAVALRLGAAFPGVRLHRPALLGHGSRVPGHVQRFEQEVNRLALGIRCAGFVGAHLCGYSLGARVALGLIARHSYLFRGATLIGVHPGLASAAERGARVGSDERWCELLLREGIARFSPAWEAQPIFASQARLPPARLAPQRRIRSAHSAPELARSLRVLGLGQMPSYRAVFGAQPLPLRLLVGSADLRFLRIAADLAQADRRVTLDVAEGVGHNLLLEAPLHVARVLTRAVAA
jgi:2-succinyl-6-hydroxy-2,4-cyclohexadiene-1-carboxylate synthase